MTLPDFSEEFTIKCDASGHGVGAVLLQENILVAFFSKALAATNLSKSVYDKEMMALVLAMQQWQHYLMGRPFKVFTDIRA